MEAYSVNIILEDSRRRARRSIGPISGCPPTAIISAKCGQPMKLVGTYPAGDSPIRLIFDGASIWALNTSTITKLRASDGARLVAYPTPSRFGAGSLACDGAKYLGDRRP